MDGSSLRAGSVTQKSLLKADLRGSCSIGDFGLIELKKSFFLALRIELLR